MAVREGAGIEIITGVYGNGTPAQNEMVNRILGADNAAERFAVYFHWYNPMHELGHGIMWFHAAERPHMVDEEMLVNQFAVAYWMHYGEADKLDLLKETVAYALAQFTRPAPAGMSHTDYARAKWGTDELFNFNNYGWFQMHCVAEILRNPIGLSAALSQMGIHGIVEQPRKTLCYTPGENTQERIAREAAEILRGWGVALPPVRITFDDDPNRHMCVIDE